MLVNLLSWTLLLLLLLSREVAVIGFSILAQPFISSRLRFAAMQSQESVGRNDGSCLSQGASEGESVHLKLQEVCNSSNETTKHNMVTIHQFINALTGLTELACVGSKRDLEIFSMHSLGRNCSEDVRYAYKEEQYSVHDQTELAEMIDLWKQERYMSKSKAVKDDWRPDTAPKVSIEMLLESNRNRIQTITANPKSVEDMKVFLQTQAEDFCWDLHAHDPVAALSDFLVTEKLQSFANWFRTRFPYYYSACLQEGCGQRDGNAYLGTVYPAAEERALEKAASRTELYHCGKCNVVSRFPRYGAMQQVLRMRRGRCGEYSVLALHMLQALGYTARWVVDRDDHVWVEVFVGGAWVHLDPCEAAVGQPLLYQSWGKTPTFVLAYTPTAVEDVSLHYSSDAQGVAARRLAEGVSEECMAELISEEQILLALNGFSST